jgi:DNA topoisomerase-1
VTDAAPGIKRRRAGRGFLYLHPGGRPVRDRPTLARIRAIVIPPAWDNVWICPHANGHIQATGRDARGRKQYRYHTRWREVRDETKFERLLAFGSALPKIRARVRRDLASTGLSRERILAAMVALLQTTLIRVGNDEYARDNGSFGLTTMRNRHVDVERGKIVFRFRGKSGKSHAIRLTDQRLARLVKRCRDLPGQELFQYVDDSGEPQPVNSADVNGYLREIAGEEFTSKDFRTWAGTLIAACQLSDETEPDRAYILRAVEAVAHQLGNTPAVARKCYIHPSVLEAYQDAAARRMWTQELGKQNGRRGLVKEESALLRFLSRRKS